VLVVVYFVTDSVRKLLGTPSHAELHAPNDRIQEFKTSIPFYSNTDCTLYNLHKSNAGTFNPSLTDSTMSHSCHNWRAAEKWSKYGNTV